MPQLCLSLLFQCDSIRSTVLPLPCHARPINAIAPQCHAPPLQVCSKPCHCPARPRVASLCLGIAFIPCVALPMPVRSPRSYSNAILSKVFQGNSFASPIESKRLRCQASVAQQFRCAQADSSDSLLPPITFPSSSSSSQRKRPLPEFLHWPSPRRMP